MGFEGVTIGLGSAGGLGSEVRIKKDPTTFLLDGPLALGYAYSIFQVSDTNSANMVWFLEAVP